MCVYLWLTQVDVWQKPIQYYKVIILQLKKKDNKKNEEEGGFSPFLNFSLIIKLQPTKFLALLPTSL